MTCCGQSQMGQQKYKIWSECFMVLPSMITVFVEHESGLVPTSDLPCCLPLFPHWKEKNVSSSAFQKYIPTFFIPLQNYLCESLFLWLNEDVLHNVPPLFMGLHSKSCHLCKYIQLLPEHNIIDSIESYSTEIKLFGPPHPCQLWRLTMLTPCA